MKRALKAGLQSALIYPGLGHFFMKKHLAAAVYALPCSVVLIVLINDMFSKADAAVAKITNGELALEVGAISEFLTSHAVGIGADDLRFLSYCLLFCWGMAAIDAVRLGMRVDREQA